MKNSSNIYIVFNNRFEITGKFNTLQEAWTHFQNRLCWNFISTKEIFEKYKAKYLKGYKKYQYLQSCTSAGSFTAFFVKVFPIENTLIAPDILITKTEAKKRNLIIDRLLVPDYFYQSFMGYTPYYHLSKVIISNQSKNNQEENLCLE